MVLLSLAAAFLLGVYLGAGLEPPASALWLFALGSGLSADLLASLRRTPLPAVLALLFVLGAIRADVVGGEDRPELSVYHGRGVVSLEGVVSEYPHTTAKATQFRFSADKIGLNEDRAETSGEGMVTLGASGRPVSPRDRPYVRYGDRLFLEGSLEAPRTLEGFDYPSYLARQGIRSTMSFPEAALLDEGLGNPLLRQVHSFRSSMADSLSKTVPEPQAALGQALLLGLRDDQPEDVVEQFRATGTSHLLAVSGLHVGILMATSLAVSQRILGRRRQLYLAAPLALVWLYALTAGMSPSVTRAAIMGSVYLAAYALGRPRSVLPALGLAAAVMVALNPNVLWSVSFQLSFAAMAGIALMAEPLAQRLQAPLEARLGRAGNPLPGLRAVALIVAMTLAATVATLPLVAFYFQRVSLVGIPATVLSLPVLPMVLLTQSAAGAVGLASTTLAQPLEWIAWLPSAYLTSVVGLVARAPGAYVETGQTGPLLVWGYFGALLGWYARDEIRRWWGGWVASIASPTRLPFLHEPAVPRWVLIPVVLAAVLLWAAALTTPDGRLHVTFADVGQGDAAFITTPGGQQVLVDGGPGPLGAVRLLGSKMPFRDRTIDMVVLTHPHSDHAGGLAEVLHRYDVANVLEREVTHDSSSYLAWRQSVLEESAEVTHASAGQLIALDGGVLIRVIGPPARLLRGTSSDIDNASVVLRLEYGDVSFLLTADTFHEGEAALVGSGVPLHSNVLKVAHHGSRSSTSPEFLAQVSPVAAVISAGEDNRFGHPHPETVDALLRYVDRELVFLTQERGSIEFVTDGRRLEVKTDR